MKALCPQCGSTLKFKHLKTEGNVATFSLRHYCPFGGSITGLIRQPARIQNKTPIAQ